MIRTKKTLKSFFALEIIATYFRNSFPLELKNYNEALGLGPYKINLQNLTQTEILPVCLTTVLKLKNKTAKNLIIISPMQNNFFQVLEETPIIF